MITSTTGTVKVQVVESMKGFPFALKFFDDDHTIYVSREVYELAMDGKRELRYIVMAWRKNQMTIEQAVEILIAEVRKYGLETGQLT